MSEKRNIKMIVEYDGTDYHGWQRQANVRSIQQVMENTVSKIVNAPVSIIASGRTDAGVHALNQVANFRTETRLPIPSLHMGINSLLPPDIVVKAMCEAPWEFHAQKDAVGKTYHYRIFNSPVRTALRRRISWFIHNPLDLGAMQRAARCLEGTHDFNSFCAAQCDVDVEDRVRTVTAASFEREDEHMILFRIAANGFLRHMVRNIVGTLADIGKGRISEQAMPGILEARDRTKAGMAAPAWGLCLAEVKYE